MHAFCSHVGPNSWRFPADLGRRYVIRVLLISFVVGLGVWILYGLIRVKSPAPPIVALLGLLGMVIGEQFDILVQLKKLDVSHATSVCLVGERYDRPH
jgi:XapX domain-containing protein